MVTPCASSADSALSAQFMGGNKLHGARGIHSTASLPSSVASRGKGASGKGIKVGGAQSDSMRSDDAGREAATLLVDEDEEEEGESDEMGLEGVCVCACVCIRREISCVMCVSTLHGEYSGPCGH